MKLDLLQKEEFISYWGRCPMVVDGAICVVENVEKLSKDKFKAAYYKYYVVPGEFEASGQPAVANSVHFTSNLEIFEPYIPDAGFYQLTHQQAFWLCRRPERARRKGFHRDNVDVIGMRHVAETSKEIVTFRDEFDFKDIARIYSDKLIKHPSESESMDECVARMSTIYGKSGFSIALSKNVALLSSALEIPLVLYKMNPVGYFIDNKILLQSKKAASLETIQEETKFSVQIYEG